MIVIKHWEILLFVLFIWSILIRGASNKNDSSTAGLCIALMALGTLPTLYLTFNVLSDIFHWLFKDITFEPF